MTSIRIADPVHQEDEARDGISTTGPSIYRIHSVSRRDIIGSTEDDICNIRSRPIEPFGTRVSGLEQPDDDPGLRNPDDFKGRQVYIILTQTM
jgi:KUP system potassium uptake protein